MANAGQRQTTTEIEELSPEELAQVGISTINYGDFDSETNSQLKELGISPNSPEILASLPFVNVYNIGQSGNLISTSNYDFMIFQTQLDLSIKEIINKKIRNDEELTDLVLTEYRESYKKFKEIKQILENYYLSNLNLFSRFHLKENLISVFSEENRTTGRSQQARVASDMSDLLKAYGMTLSDESLLDFISKSSLAPEPPTGNSFYKSMCQMINNSLLGFPFHGFSVGGSLTNYMLPESGVYGSIGYGIDSANFKRGISLVSRCNTYSIENPVINSILDIDGEGSSISSYDYLSIKELGDNRIGNKDLITLDGSKLIDKANISTSSDRFSIIPVEVFNKSIKREKAGPKVLTGKAYFGSDIISYLEKGESLDSQAYFSNLRDTFIKLRDGIGNQFNINEFDIFNSAIKTFASILYEGLNLQSMTTDSKIIATTGDTDQLASALGLVTFGDQRFERYVTLNSGEVESSADISSDINSYEYVVFEETSEDAPFFNVVGEGNAFFGGSSFEFYKPYYENALTLPQYDSLKGSKKRVVAKVNSNETTTVYSSLLRDTIRRVVSFANNQNYLFKYFVIDVFINFAREILSDFYFSSYTDGNEEVISSNNTNLLFDQDSINIIAAIRDLAEGTAFRNNNTDKILGYQPSSPESNKLLVKIKSLYREITLEGAASYNIASAMVAHTSNILSNISSLGQDFEKISNEGILRACIPTIEALTNLNIAAEKIYLPTSCFSPEPSFFTYLGSRNSKDLGIINSVLTANPNSIDFYESEETKVIAIGIPDGLIDNLRTQAGFSTKHTIIEISFYEVNHKRESQENEFSKVYSYYFNSCLHVNSVDRNQNLNDIENITDIDSFNRTSYVDNTSTFENITLDDENVLTFNFGEVNDGIFNLKKVNTFDDAIQYNKNFQISAPDINFNDAFSNEIVRSHVINYGLKKKFELFSGISFDEFSFPQEYKSSININTSSSSVIEKNVSRSGIQLINYFENQEYTDDLKDYLKRTALQSAVINSKYFLEKSYALSKFERVFLIPAHKSDLRNESSDFDFKTLIPVVSIL